MKTTFISLQSGKLQQLVQLVPNAVLYYFFALQLRAKEVAVCFNLTKNIVKRCFLLFPSIKYSYNMKTTFISLQSAKLQYFVHLDTNAVLYSFFALQFRAKEVAVCFKLTINIIKTCFLLFPSIKYSYKHKNNIYFSTE